MQNKPLEEVFSLLDLLQFALEKSQNEEFPRRGLLVLVEEVRTRLAREYQSEVIGVPEQLRGPSDSLALQESQLNLREKAVQQSAQATERLEHVSQNITPSGSLGAGSLGGGDANRGGAVENRAERGLVARIQMSPIQKSGSSFHSQSRPIGMSPVNPQQAHNRDYAQGERKSTSSSVVPPQANSIGYVREIRLSESPRSQESSSEL